MSGADEFEVIRELFAPLALSPGARSLLDDAAVLDTCGPLVITTDAIVEGVHFLAADPIATVAQKALRVNLSDLAAKAATPIGYLLTLLWPEDRPASELAGFAEGLAKDQAEFSIPLLGGDTVSTPGPLAVSVTAFGALEGARAPDRRAGGAGQDLWVSGVIGDGWLGLQAARSGEHPRRDRLIARYRTPEPRLTLAPLLRLHAAAAMDVSDGLLADAAKLAQASGLAAELDLKALPLSPEGEIHAAGGEARLLELARGGDDYEILFSAESEARGAIEAAQAGLPYRLTRVGRLLPGSGLRLVGLTGAVQEAPPRGFAHRLGR